MSEDEARRLVKRWRPGQLLSLSGLELEYLIELPPNLEELDISNNNITDFSSLPKSLRKLIYQGSYGMIKILNIDLPNLKELDLSYNNIKSIERLPKGLKSLNLSYSENLKEATVFYNNNSIPSAFESDINPFLKRNKIDGFGTPKNWAKLILALNETGKYDAEEMLKFTFL